jgi:hypothetical protein
MSLRSLPLGLADSMRMREVSTMPYIELPADHTPITRSKSVAA